MRTTRKTEAKELLKRLERGPMMLDADSPLSPIYPKEARGRAAENYRLWVQTWIIPSVLRLVPELKELKGKE